MSTRSIVVEDKEIEGNEDEFAVVGSDWTLLSQGAEARIWKVPVESLPFKVDKEIDEMDDGDATTKKKKNAASASATKTTTKYVVAKERFRKSYRHPALDERLTKQRCRAEAKLLRKIWNRRRSVGGADGVDGSVVGSTTSGRTAAGNFKLLLRVPRVVRAVPPVLYLEYFGDDCATVRRHLEERVLQRVVDVDDVDVDVDNSAIGPTNDDDETTTKDDAKDDAAAGAAAVAAEQRRQRQRRQVEGLARQLGSALSYLHYELGIAHGDLTTSNMMIRTAATDTNKALLCSGKDDDSQRHDEDDTTDEDADNNNDIRLIDFGLAKNTESAEERAVDLYVLERALLSTHPRLAPYNFFDMVLRHYSDVGGGDDDGNDATGSATNNQNGKEKTAVVRKQKQATLARLEQVRLRGRKRECFG